MNPKPTVFRIDGRFRELAPLLRAMIELTHAIHIAERYTDDREELDLKLREMRQALSRTFWDRLHDRASWTRHLVLSLDLSRPAPEVRALAVSDDLHESDGGILEDVELFDEPTPCAIQSTATSS